MLMEEVYTAQHITGDQPSGYAFVVQECAQVDQPRHGLQHNVGVEAAVQDSFKTSSL